MNGPFKEEDAGPLMRQVSSSKQPSQAQHGRSTSPLLTPSPFSHQVMTARLLPARARHRPQRHQAGQSGLRQQAPRRSDQAHRFWLRRPLLRSQPLRGLCGTPDYAAPEILTWYSVDKTTKPQGTAYAQPVDMWSLGVVLYILLCGFPPFYGDDDEQMFALIRSGSYSFPEAIDGYKTTWGGVSDGAKALVRSLLTVQPAQRASATDVLTGDWLGSVCTPRGGWIGKMRERSTSGWRAAAKPDGKEGDTRGPAARSRPD